MPASTSHPSNRPRLLVEELEPRILYSADAAVLLGVGIAPPAALVRQLETAPPAVNAPEAALAAPVQVEAQATDAQAASAREIVFIDSRVTNAMQLADELMHQRGANRMFEIVMLDANEDGVAQIERALAGEHGLAAIHIISHGSDGEVEIGSTRLDGAQLALDQSRVARWGDALAPDGDLLLYGCKVAQSASGQLFVRELSHITGVDVAASTDNTGAVSVGGNWRLEFATGAIDTQLTPATFDALSWQGRLATFTVTNTNDSGPGSLRQAIIDANASPGADTITFNIPLTDANHVYYRDNAVAGTFSAPVATTLADAAIADFDADYVSGTARSWYRISLAGNYLDVTQALVIDGSTQPGYSVAAGPVIEINAAGVTTPGDANAIALTTGASTIRGLVINNAGDNAIEVDAGAGGSAIVGNFLGTDVSGTQAKGNSRIGSWGAIAIKSNNVVVGGATAADRNLISGNLGSGIEIYNAATGAVIQGNYIGTTVTGATALGNATAGIDIRNNSANNAVGGIAAGAGNTIAFNGGDGVSIVTNVGGNVVRGNSIYSNTGLAIDLNNDGVTANDLGDGDAGPNALKNFPVVTVVKTSGSTVTVSGSLNTTANATHTIDFYSSPSADSTGYGEGATYLGSTVVTTDAAGNASFSNVSFAKAVSVGYVVSAVTVDLASGNTSEFARSAVAVSSVQATITVDTVNDVSDGNTTSLSALLANKGADGFVSLREAIAAANNTANGTSADRIVFNIAGAGPHTINLAAALPVITDAAIIDGSTEPDFVTNGNRPIVVIDGNGLSGDGLNLSSTADGSTIKGLVIRNFVGSAIYVTAGSDGNTIVGNYLGALDTNGAYVAGKQNTDRGVILEGANNTVGGATATLRNVVAGNNYAGLSLSGSSSTGNVVIGNYVGVAADGTTAVTGSAFGVVAWNAAANNRVGGTAAGEGNIIGNAGVGVDIDGSGGNVLATAILGNSISGNSGLGIDLGTYGVTANDAGDADAGPNSLQNFPVLATARTDGSGQLILTGSLNSTANTQFRIELFANATQDGSGYGEGQRYLGFVNVSTDGSGNATFSTTLTATVAVGEFISATATRSNAGFTAWTDTSEFARSLAAVSSVQATVTVDTVSDVSDGDTTSLSTLLANKGADGFVSLREAIAAANNTANGTSADRIVFNIAGAGPHTINVSSALPLITDAVIIDASTEPGFAGTPVVALDGLAAGNGVNGLILSSGSSGSTVRGLAIGGFDSGGIYVTSGSNGNLIAGNYIGTDVSGTLARPNGRDGSSPGISLFGNGNLMGGLTAADRNLVSGNWSTGVWINGNANLVQGNYIGTDASGAVALGNIWANVGFALSASGNVVGGTALGAGNTIAYGSGTGVMVHSATNAGNALLGNRIMGNAGLGIDLGNDGVTANDLGDADTGANNLQNFPVLATARTDGSGQLILTGSLNSTSSTTVRIEFFANTSQDGSGYGEGQRYLGFANVTTDAAGNAAINATLSASVAVGEFISATATKINAGVFTDTSEFARNIAAVSSVQATITVDTVSDVSDGDTTSLSALLANKGADGFVSLREAIAAANNTANGSGGADRIQFNIAGTGIHTITLSTMLPTITGQVVIDATTDDSFTANGNRPAIVLDGNNIIQDGLELYAGSDGSTIRGLVIERFTDDGIDIASSNDNLVAGNWIGSDSTGNAAAGNFQGVNIFAGNNNVVGGTTAADRNVLSGNSYAGVWLGGGGTGNQILGNYIGTNASGAGALGNGGSGILVYSGGNVIGGAGAGARNVISGNAQYGISFEGASASGNTVAGNYIGLTAAGSAVLGNGNDGVLIIDGASNNTIGGSTAAARNVIAGNSDGVQIGGALGGSNNNTVRGNYIGTDATGTVAFGNNDDGVDIDNAALNNQVIDNLISGSISDGIDLGDAGASTGTVIRGNLIGTAANGTDALGNAGHGIFIGNGGTANNTTIGGAAAGQGNTIAFNAGDGIYIPASTAVAILGNSIHDNTGSGIDLGTNGVSANDLGDADSGANNLQNFPVLASAALLGGGLVRFDGALNSAAGSTFRIEFFASAGADASGYGEGQRYLGFADVTTDAAGNATISATLSASVAAGEFVSATATKVNAGVFTDTSEFAANVVAKAPGVTLTPTSGPVTTEAGGTASFTVVLDTRPTANVTIAITSGDTTEGTVSTTLLTFTAANWNVAQTVTVTGVQDFINDGSVAYSVITGIASSGDAAYNGLDPADVALTNTEVANQPPVNAVPAAQTVNEDATLVFSAANGNAISVADADAGGSPLQVTLTVTNGTLTLGGTTGLTITGGANGSASMSFTGTASAINTALNGLAYAPTVDFNGAASLTITTNDQGNSGTGGARTDSDGVGISVTAVNDAPVASGSAALAAMLEDMLSPGGATVASLFAGNFSNAADAGNPAQNQLAGIGVRGQSVNAAEGRWQYSIDGGTTWNLFGALSDTAASSLGLNDRIRFLPAANYNGAPTDLTVRLIDNSTTVTSGALVDMSARGGTTPLSNATVTLSTSITSVNDAPVGTGNTVTTSEDTARVFTAADFGFTDPGDSPANALQAVTITTLPSTGALTLSGALVSAGQSVSLANINAGNLVFTPAPNANGAGYASFGFQVQDDGGTANGGVDLDPTVRTLTIDVTPVNDAPVITSNGGGATAGMNVAENATAVTGVSASDVDVPAQTLTYSIVGGADAAKFTINGSTGALSFISAPDYENPADAGANNVYDVLVQVSDGALTDTQAIAVTVTPVNDNAPVITSNGGGAAAAISIAENATSVTTVVASDADLPAQTLTYSIVGGADAGRFAIDANTGALSFVAAANYEVPADAGADNVYDLTVQVSDGALTDTQAIEVTVTPVNDNAPVITSNGGGALASVGIAENTTTVTTVAAADADLPVQTLTYSIVGGVDAAKFTIDANTGALSFVAAPDYDSPGDTGANNVYDVTVQVSDGSFTDTQAIAVNVTPVNDNAPVITSNGAGATASVSIGENTTPITTVAASDADLPAQTLTYSIIGGADAARFVIDANTGALSFAAAPDYEAPTDVGANNVYDVTVQVSDGSLTDTQAIAVTVTPSNDNAPVIASNGGGSTASVSIAENATAVTAVAASDADLPTQTLTYSIVGGADAARFVIDANSGALSFVIAPDYENPSDAGGVNVYDVTVQVSDGTLSDTQAIAVTVTPVNENAPVIVSNGGGGAASVSVAENTMAVTIVVAGDADLPAQTLTYSIVGGADAAKFTIDANSGALSFIAAPNYEAPTDAGADNVYDVTVQVSDGGFTDAQAIAVTVTPANDNAPVISSNGGGVIANVGIAENTTAITTVAASDADLPAQTLTYSIVGGVDAARFVIDAHTGALSFVAAPDHENPADAGADNVYDVTVQASDGTLTDTQAIAVTVRDVNEAPHAADRGATVDEGAGLTLDLTAGASDPDAGSNGVIDPTGVVVVAGPARGSLVLHADGSATYTHDGSETTGDSFSYRVRDAAGALSNVATVRLTVTPVDDAPTVTAATLTLASGEAVVLDATRLSASDPDSDAASLTFNVGAVSNGRFEWVATPGAAIDSFTQGDVAAGRVRFVSTSDTGAPAFRVTAFDGQAHSAEVAASVVFKATAAPRPEADPVASPPAAIVAPSDRSNPEAEAAAPLDAGAVRATATAAPDLPAPGREIDTADAAIERYEPGARRLAGLPGGEAPLHRSQGGWSDLDIHAIVADDYLATTLQLPALDATPLVRTGLRGGPAHADIGGIESSADADTNELSLADAARLGALALTAGTVWWALRAGGLLSSLLVSLPAWRHADLLVVLPDDEDDDTWDAAEDDEAARDDQAAGRVFEPAFEGE